LTLFLCVLWQRYYHQARVQAQFEHRAVTLADVLQSKLIGLLGALESISDLYSANLEGEGDRLFGVIAMFVRHPMSEFVLQALATIATNIALGLERLQAREALHESELRFRQLAEHIHEVFNLFEIVSQ